MWHVRSYYAYCISQRLIGMVNTYILLLANELIQLLFLWARLGGGD